MYRPTGSVVQLMDGRVFKRNKKNQNLWENINTGAMLNEQQLNLMITSAAFTADASGGGNTKRETASPPAEPPSELTSVSLSAPFDDIVGIYSSTQNFNANRTINTSLPVTLRLTFQPGTYVSSSAVVVYKNNSYLQQTRPGSSPPSPITFTETFANGDQLKFGFSNNGLAVRNYDVILEKIAPGSVQVLDTFNLSSPLIGLSEPFNDIVASNSSEVQNNQSYVSTVIGPLTIRLNFSSGVYNGVNGSLLVYKDTVYLGGSVTLIDTISVSSRPNGTGLYVLSQTFEGNYLKFGFLGGDGGNNFDVTVEKTAPDGLLTMDTFNVRATYAS